MKAWSFLLGGSQLTGWRSDAEIWASNQHIEVPIVVVIVIVISTVIVIVIVIVIWASDQHIEICIVLSSSAQAKFPVKNLT